MLGRIPQTTWHIKSKTVENINVYYDITPPDLTLAEIPGALPDGTGGWRVFTNTIQVAIDINDLGGGGFGVPRLLIASESEPGATVTEELERGVVAGHPDAYGATVTLSTSSTPGVVCSTLRKMPRNALRLGLLI